MNVFLNVWERVKALFGKAPQESRFNSHVEEVWEKMYKDITLMNFAEIFANRLTNYTLDGAEAICDDEQINECLQSCWDMNRKWEQMAYGLGRVYLVPYVMNNKIYTDIIPQSRVEVMATDGNDPVSIAVLADVRSKDNKWYERWTLYEFNEQAKTFLIQNKATERNGRGEIALNVFDDWATIEPEIVIQGVEKPLFSYVDCPKDNRQSDLPQGASIVFGCEDTIAEIRKTLVEYSKEYDLKRTFVGVDRMMVDKKTGRVPDIFKTFEGKSTESLFEIFSPDIRSDAYKNRLLDLFSMLEKQVGTSSGILTPAETNMGTATQVRRSAYDTMALVETARRSIVKAIERLCYCYDIYLTVIGVGHSSDYAISYKWKDSMLKDINEEFSRLLQAQHSDIVSKAEVRKLLFPDETEEEAEKALQEIMDAKPEEDFSQGFGFGG